MNPINPATARHTRPAVTPDRATYLSQARSHRLLSLSLSLPADLVTPISLFRRFDDGGPAFLLESVMGGERWARYSIMGRRPLMRICYRDGRLSGNVGELVLAASAWTGPLACLSDLLEQYALPQSEKPLPFRCGLVGYFAYDFVRTAEVIPDCNPDPLGLPDCDLMAPADVLIFDHLKNDVVLIGNHLTGCDPAADYDRAAERLLALADQVLTATDARPADKPICVRPVVTAAHAACLPDRNDYLDTVRKAKQYIRAGDIFQVVLSRRFSRAADTDPLTIYRALRRVNPSPYLFFLRASAATLVGASPEMLVRLDGRRIETCPIAGTRRRGQTAEEDKRLADELLADEKENAEHAMLVDLARNDVGRLSRFGSVQVRTFRQVERFSHVMHLVSEVEGVLRDDLDPVAVLSALLPAGTLSGAPKIRAMEIIDELEPVRRGPYGGAVGYLGFDGRIDTCITIRTAVVKDGFIHVQAGAGIVADSVPETEYDEVVNKARALFAALEEAGDLA
jgi:anthranilate synthase component 1